MKAPKGSRVKTKIRIFMKEAGMAKNGPAPKIEDCSAPMRIAFRRLADAGYTATVCSEHQLKVDDLNFWPGTGTIGRDGKGRLRQTGIDAFIDILNAEYQVVVLSPKTSAPTPIGLPPGKPVSAPPAEFTSFPPVPKRDAPPVGRKFSPPPEIGQEGETPLYDGRRFLNIDLYG